MSALNISGFGLGGSWKEASVDSNGHSRRLIGLPFGSGISSNFTCTGVLPSLACFNGGDFGVGDECHTGSFWFTNSWELIRLVLSTESFKWNLS